MQKKGQKECEKDFKGLEEKHGEVLKKIDEEEEKYDIIVKENKRTLSMIIMHSFDTLEQKRENRRLKLKNRELQSKIEIMNERRKKGTETD